MGTTVSAAALGDLADELPSLQGPEQTTDVLEATDVRHAFVEERQESDSGGMFDRFLFDHYPRAVSMLRHWTGSREIAEDLAQESAVRLLRYQSLQTPIAWKRIFHRIVINTFNDWGRQQRSLADRRSLPLDLEVHEQIADPQADMDRLHGSREQLGLVMGAIETLPTKCRQIFLMSRFAGLSNQEIAQRMGISIRMVEKQISKALMICRRQMDSEAGG